MSGNRGRGKVMGTRVGREHLVHLAGEIVKNIVNIVVRFFSMTVLVVWGTFISNTDQLG